MADFCDVCCFDCRDSYLQTKLVACLDLASGLVWLFLGLHGGEGSPFSYLVLLGAIHVIVGLTLAAGIATKKKSFYKAGIFIGIVSLLLTVTLAVLVPLEIIGEDSNNSVRVSLTIGLVANSVLDLFCWCVTFLYYQELSETGG